MRIRRKYVKQIVDVLHEVISSSECGGYESWCKCKRCKKTIQKVHTIVYKLHENGIIDDDNHVLDQRKWCKDCNGKR